MATLDQGMLDLADDALEARRAGDRELFEAKLAAAELLDARYDEAARALGVPVCTGALSPTPWFASGAFRVYRPTL